MNREIPRVLALHDLSGFGRCALTVVIPVMSSLGIQVCPVPTAVLSTHTGGFTDFAFQDMTDFMKDNLRHYKELNLSFDGVYSGFLGSAEQCDIVEEYIDFFGQGKVLVDPVLGDNGVLYSTVTDSLVSQMRRLVSKAKLITPNVTEGAYLLEESITETLTKEKAIQWAKQLCNLGPSQCVLTGVHLKEEDGKMFSVFYDKGNECSLCYGSKEVYGEYPGAGDAFASAFLSYLLKEESPEKCLKFASDYVYQKIKLAKEQGCPAREGLPLEQ